MSDPNIIDEVAVAVTGTSPVENQTPKAKELPTDGTRSISHTILAESDSDWEWLDSDSANDSATEVPTISEEPNIISSIPIQPDINQATLQLLDSEAFSDVTFVVGEKGCGNFESIKAHKLFLMARSSVFQQLFRDKMMEEMVEIEILGIQPNAFKKFLKFVYTDEFSIMNCDSSLISDVLQLAEKYSVSKLIKLCKQHKEIGVETEHRNQITVYQLIEVQQYDTSPKNIKLINAASKLLQEEIGVNDINSLFIKLTPYKLLPSSSALSTDEIKIKLGFLACASNGLDVNLRNCFHNLKYNSPSTVMEYMTPQEFGRFVMNKNDMTDNEIINLLRHCIKSPKPWDTLPQGMFSERRQNVTFVANVYSTSQDYYYPVGDSDLLTTNRMQCLEETVSFMADQDIFITGFGLYGPSTASLKNHCSRSYDITLSIACKLKKLQRKTFTWTVTTDTDYDKDIDVPFPVGKNCGYTVNVSIKGNITQVGDKFCSVSDVDCNGMNVAFGFVRVDRSEKEEYGPSIQAKRLCESVGLDEIKEQSNEAVSSLPKYGLLRALKFKW